MESLKEVRGELPPTAQGEVEEADLGKWLPVRKGTDLKTPAIYQLLVSDDLEQQFSTGVP